MAASNDFIAVNWNSNQLIDEDSLDQINNNINWLKNNSLTGQYQTATGYPLSTGLKILAGKTTVPGQGTTDIYADIYFAKAFTQGSSPVITYGVYVGTWICGHSLMGLDGTGNIDHRGFKIHIQSNIYGPIPVNPIVNWTAVGY